MDARLADACAAARSIDEARPVGRGRAVRRAAAGDGRGHPRQDDDTGVLVEGRHRLARGTASRATRGIRRRRRADPAAAARPRSGSAWGLVGRHRRRRIGPDPGGVHRDGRAEADVRTDPALPAEPVRDAVTRRADDPDRARRRGAARCHHRLRRARLVGDADAVDVVPGRARRRGGRPADRATRPISASSATIRRSMPRSAPPSTSSPSAGAEVDEVDPGFSDPVEAFHVLWFSGEAKVLAWRYGDLVDDRVDPGLRRTASIGSAYIGVGLSRRDGGPDAAGRADGPVPPAATTCCVTPTLPLPAFPVGQDVPGRLARRRTGRAGRRTPIRST